MSQTLSQQIDAATAALSAALDAINADVSTMAADLTKLLGELQPGAVVTQAQVDALAALEAKATAIDTAAKASIATVP